MVTHDLVFINLTISTYSSTCFLLHFFLPSPRAQFVRRNIQESEVDGFLWASNVFAPIRIHL
eukprot:c8719_g1_i1 orf=183-368(+)